MTDAMMTAGRVAALYRYPVKGMTPESLDRVELQPGEAIAFDRAYAIENGAGRFDEQAPRYLAKINFLMLMRDERLATLDARFDDATQVLTILRDGKQVARGNLSTAIGRKLIEQFIGAYMKDALRGAPRIVSAEGHSFSDVPVKCLHVVNLASVRELERIAGRPVDPLRFRANVYVDGLAPWAEFDWIDGEIKLGAARLSAFARTQRCDATNVDPATGARDMAIPAVLMRQWRHSDFGVYAKVVEGGAVTVGDGVALG